MGNPWQPAFRSFLKLLLTTTGARRRGHPPLQLQVPKIGSYNIPNLSATMKSEGGAGSKCIHLIGRSWKQVYPFDRVPNGDKIDIFDFGAILLEVVSGRPISSR